VHREPSPRSATAIRAAREDFVCHYLTCSDEFSIIESFRTSLTFGNGFHELLPSIF
jgi:hypothetical protein